MAKRCSKFVNLKGSGRCEREGLLVCIGSRCWHFHIGDLKAGICSHAKIVDDNMFASYGKSQVPLDKACTLDEILGLYE